MTTSWAFSAQAKADALELAIFDVIGGDGTTAKKILDQITSRPHADRIVLRINSAGGDVADALAIHNLLARHRARVEVTIEGVAASAASVIAMAGHRIVMPENALMMIHAAWTRASGNHTTLRRLADTLEKVSDQIVAIYASRTKQPRQQIKKWMNEETWFTAAEAKRYGFADEVVRASGIAALAAPPETQRERARIFASLDTEQQVSLLRKERDRFHTLQAAYRAELASGRTRRAILRDAPSHLQIGKS